MHNIIFIRRRFGKEKGNAILLILAVASLAILALGIGLLIWVGV
jgi:hypothetical protein